MNGDCASVNSRICLCSIMPGVDNIVCIGFGPDKIPKELCDLWEEQGTNGQMYADYSRLARAIALLSPLRPYYKNIYSGNVAPFPNL